MIITRLRFDTKAAVPKLFFQPMRWLSDDEYAITSKKGESTEAKQAVTMSVSKKKEAPLQLEGAKPTAKKAEEATAEVDEPEVRKPAVKPNAVPAKKVGKLADVMDEWETDDA
jgi:hypothetical protein